MGFVERHQVALYLGSMAVGVACAGLGGWSQVSEHLVPYALGALLWTNFALMPLAGMNVGQHKMLVRRVVLAATLGTPILVALLVPLFNPEGRSRCFRCSNCSVGSMRGLRCGLYVYYRRGISRFAGGNTLPTWRPDPFYSYMD